MATLIGAVVDVSGSMAMAASVGKETHGNTRKWARSVFSVVENLVHHDVSSSNYVFVLGFGASGGPDTFDILNTIQKANAIKNAKPPSALAHIETAKPPSVSANISHTERLEAILSILENNGAPRVRKWAKMSLLESAVSENDSELFLDWLSHDEWFRNKIVNKCLPDVCRHSPSRGGSFAREGASRMVKKVHIATEKAIKDVVHKGQKLLRKRMEFQEVPLELELSEVQFELVSIDETAVMDVHEASNILHGCIGQNNLTNDRVDELMELVEPYIYGLSPLVEAVRAAINLFAMEQYKENKKLLFILSDGVPTDANHSLASFATDDIIAVPAWKAPVAELLRLDVKTVCCYITNHPIDNPKRLYSSECATWNRAARLMFNMSSYIPTQSIPRTIFLRRGWTIDIDNNETRLFVQVNHPDIIEDVCELATDVVCCQEALSDVLSSVSLDLYINQANQGFVPKNQQGETCYANASAAVLHLAMLRIVGRKGGYPDFFQLRREIIATYGEQGGSTVKVLREICPKYRLQCEEVDVLGALKAVAEKRPVLATFRLTDAEWDTFSVFYQTKPREALTKSELDIKRRSGSAELSGHAVVLTSFSSRGLRLMNSWGSKWADGGFFTVSNADVLDLKFMDVFWTITDLKQSELAAYKTNGAGIAQKLMSRLRGLQSAQYKCPLCHRESNVVDFSGHALETTCPKCRREFNVSETDDDLALNLYLLSLSASSRRSK